MPGQWDENVAGNFAALLPPALADRFRNARELNPTLFDVDEDELVARLGGYPGAVINMLRLRLWYEVEIARAMNMPEVQVARIVVGICSVPAFYGLLSTSKALAWMACAPASHDMHIEEMIVFGASWARKIMRMPAEDPETGKPNLKLMKLQYDLYLDAQMRKMGGYAQKQVNLNVPGPGARAAALETQGTPVVQTQVKALVREQKKAALPSGGPKKVTADDV